MLLSTAVNTRSSFTCVLVLVTAVVPSAAEPHHPVAFWRQIASDKYAVPPGSDLVGLTNENRKNLLAKLDVLLDATALKDLF